MILNIDKVGVGNKFTEEDMRNNLSEVFLKSSRINNKLHSVLATSDIEKINILVTNETNTDKIIELLNFTKCKNIVLDVEIDVNITKEIVNLLCCIKKDISGKLRKSFVTGKDVLEVFYDV